MKPTYIFVFVVLVYRNTQDLEDFFAHLNIPQTKVVVVNSYYDEKSEIKFKEIAVKNDADFISVPNKGYGAGNNRGADFVLNHYQFRYLIISNADIEIKQLNVGLLKGYDNDIIAPDIITLTNKHQNPFLVHWHPLLDRLKAHAFKKNRKIPILFGTMITKIEREAYLKVVLHLFGKKRIYAAHGAFIIIPFSIMKKLHPIYNERMFLFAEEEHLAQLARSNNIAIVYNPSIKILHKEDGSTSLLDNTFKYIRESYIEFYNYWYKK